MKTNKTQSRKRQPNQKKAGNPGEKSMRGKPENPYGEIKQRFSYSLTPTCHAKLQDLAQELGCSGSEVLERFSRIASEISCFLQAEQESNNQDGDAE